MTATATCIHYWVIEESKGRERSPGTCKRCGARSTFPNSPYYDYRESFISSSESDYAQTHTDAMERLS